MRLTIKLTSLFFMLLLSVSPVILLEGCGTIDKEEGCPGVNTFYSSCVNYANDGDTITGPSDASLTMAAGFPGGTVYYVPLQYVVRDSAGAPRNNVCVDFYTDGFFYADINYTTLAPSSGFGSKMTQRTNDRGVICVYWSTETLPASPAAGSEDVTGQSFVNAMSGTPFDDYLVEWTVKALPSP
jgi:hypothetical protein